MKLFTEYLFHSGAVVMDLILQVKYGLQYLFIRFIFCIGAKDADAITGDGITIYLGKVVEYAGTVNHSPVVFVWFKTPISISSLSRRMIMLASVIIFIAPPAGFFVAMRWMILSRSTRLMVIESDFGIAVILFLQ